MLGWALSDFEGMREGSKGRKPVETEVQREVTALTSSLQCHTLAHAVSSLAQPLTSHHFPSPCFCAFASNSQHLRLPQQRAALSSQGGDLELPGNSHCPPPAWVFLNQGLILLDGASLRLVLHQCEGHGAQCPFSATQQGHSCQPHDCRSHHPLLLPLS